MPVAAPAAAAPSHGVHAHRVIFIDLARALAVVFMVYGPSVDALLARQYRAGTWFDVWQFQRGLTSCLFLLLSGFAFSIATARHWPSHTTWSRSLLRRTRRFSLFVVLGYALHFPVSRFADLTTASHERWQSFLAVDVLQLIGVSFVLVQVLVLIARTRRAFMIAALMLAAGAVVVTPALWSMDWSPPLPMVLGAYLAPSAAGSQFPLFPWAAYVLLGAGLGQIYARWGAAHLSTYANAVLLGPGVLLVACGLTLAFAAPHAFGAGQWSWLPPQVMVRAGSCLVGLALMAHASASMTRLPHVFGAVAQETLLIYFVHLCIVYGSIWNTGLAQRFGASLTPGETVLTVVIVLGSMVLLAYYWNWQKHVRPQMARWMSFAAAALLIYRLV
jgi:uncharacterized membrane protein